MSVVHDTRKRFGTLATIDGGYDVIALDTGRPVAHRDSLASANGVAQTLNAAGMGGGRALAKVLVRLRSQGVER